MEKQPLWWFCKKVKDTLSLQPNSHTPLNIYPRKMKSYGYENLYMMLIAALFAISQTEKHPNILQWVGVDGFKNPWYIHKMEIDSAIKEKLFLHK